MKKKLLYIAPHLSTGGLPQYLVKKIELLRDEFEIYVVEYENITGGVLVVQRNKLLTLLPLYNLKTLGNNKEELITFITEIDPDIIHIEEIPELFMDHEIAERIYSNPFRSYKIIETSHDSSYDVTQKRFFPDKFMFVSPWQIEQYKDLNIPKILVEYPIEYKPRPNREETLIKLGLNPSKKHILHVGLFTPRKNQAEFFEYAKILPQYEFHCIGNQADNFKHYWEPLMKNKPPNLTWWNERSDVDTFYSSMDLFLFTSRGHEYDKETSPLVIREALGWNMNILIYNLEVYMGMYNKFDNIKYLNESIDMRININLINETLEPNKETFSEYSLLDGFNGDDFDISFEQDNNKINFNYKRTKRLDCKISIKDKDSNTPMFSFDANFENNSSWWAIPIPKVAFDFVNDPSFSTFLIEFYDRQDNLLFSKEIFLKEATKKRTVKFDLINPFDCLFNNYNEMFVERKYDCYELKNLDVVLDLGANNGLFSYLCYMDGCKSIYAFEPNQDALKNLNHIFKDIPSVQVIDKAIYYKDGDLKFYVDKANTTIGSINKSHVSDNTATTTEEITIPAISLKTFIQESGINKISLLKIDIEGAEYEIIEHLEDEIFEMTDSFLIEFHDNTDKKVIRLVDKLLSHGFEIEQIRDQNSKNNDSIIDHYIDSQIGTILARKKITEEKILTVLIPTYNHEDYIEECVDSVLKQITTFKFDIIIQNDCSTDKTLKILEKYKSIAGVYVYSNEENMGSTSTMVIKALNRCNSKYITILDGDDYYIDEFKLQKQVEFLEANPEYNIHSTGYYITKEDAIHYKAYHELFLNAVEPETSLKDNLLKNYVTFGFMFRSEPIKNRQFPKWFTHKDIFDGYWALINLLLETGKSKNESWTSGRYRITKSGAFGEKEEKWKEEQIQKQSEVFKQVYEISTPKPILIVDAFFHDESCKKTFNNYVSFIKELDIPIMLITNSKLDTSLTEQMDYVFYDKNNRLFEQEYDNIEDIYFWYSDPNHIISLGTKGLQKHGLSVLSNLYHSTNLAKSLGYTHFFRIEYDCEIDKIENVKNIIKELPINKKGMTYLHQDRYLSFQLFYFDLEYFTSIFPKINNEQDYKKEIQRLSNNNTFISAEEFIYELIKESGTNNIIIKDAPFMYTDFGNCKWNTVMTPLESESIYDKFISSIFRVCHPSPFVHNLPISEYGHDVDITQAAIVTWNCCTEELRSAFITIEYPNGDFKTIKHETNWYNDHKVEIIDIPKEGDINVNIKIGEVEKHYVINQNNIKNAIHFYKKHI
jgi:FkbM family methyltransferase